MKKNKGCASPGDPARAHEIGEALLVPHPLKEPRGHPAEEFVGDLPGVEVGRVEDGARECLEDDGLLAGLRLHKVRRMRRARVGLAGGERSPRGHLEEEPLEFRYQALRLEIARHGKDDPGSDQETLPEGGQVGGLRRGDTLLIALGAQCERMAVKVPCTQHPPGEGDHVVAFLLEARELGVALDGERRGGERG